MRRWRCLGAALLLTSTTFAVAIRDDKPHPTSDKHNIFSDIADDVKESISHVTEDVSQIIHRSAFAGKIFPVLSKFIISREKAGEIWQSLSNVAKWEDVLFIVLLGWATVPLVEYPYNKFVSPPLTSDSDQSTSVEKGERKPFRQTNLFQVADHASQMAKIALLVYVADVLGIIINSIGFKIKRISLMSQTFAKVAYTVWAAWRVKIFKRYLIIEKSVKSDPASQGRAKVLNHLLDAALILITALRLLDVMAVQMGFALKSIFAFGSAGTLVMSLASKDLAAQVMSGLSLSASDKVYEGDEVRIGNDLSGIVQDMGWMGTIIRTPDELVVSVPNSQLTSQRLINVSRAKKCQVKQVLRFRYEDTEKLPATFEDIKREIVASCPKVITDGSRAFRVHWRDYRDDHLEAVLDCHFNLPATGTVYWDNRQAVLMAVDRAVKKNGVQFVTEPRYH